MSRAEGNWCISCHAYDDEAARDDCQNPQWHMPKPALQPIARLPYKSDDERQ